MSHRLTNTLLAVGAALLIGQASALISQAGAMAQPPEHAGKSGQAPGETSGQPPAQAERGDRDRGQMDDSRERHGERGHQQSRYHISTREQTYLRDWYSRNLPPGLAKQGKVPPGHAKRLQRGSTWPPQGVDYQRLPRELVRNLSPLPDHMRYYRVGTDVVIADMAGQVVSDVVYDVLN
ncbi:MAG TPA: hypothetical protein ENO19_02150 [Halothiobacillaceae bacterium]|nr:hypothetical protein [Halothiobacillaceae bacterium]